MTANGGQPDSGQPATHGLGRYVPILDWGRRYNRAALTNDLIAAVIVSIMLIPQSLAYALLAGLPAIMGLYASILPLVIYAIFGTSRTLAVGPVAIISLMTATAIGNFAQSGSPDYIAAAIILAILSGLILIVMGLFRLGFIANFLSHPVIAGFITATSLIIAASQLKHILGITASGSNLHDLLVGLISHLPDTNPITVAIGGGAWLFLHWSRRHLKPLLLEAGLSAAQAGIATKAGPVLAVLVTGLLSWVFDLQSHGVRIVGDIPQGLPPLTMPGLDADLWLKLAGPALLIAVIGFVESVSMAQTLAAKRRQRIVPDQELIALGASSVAAGFTGGYPVTGGFARSVVNFDAGAETPAAGRLPPSALRWRRWC